MSLSQLELERQARIKANQARLAEIGLDQAVRQIAAAQAEAGPARRKPNGAARVAARKAAGERAPGRVRRSERVAGIDAPNYNENARVLALADGGVREGGARDRRLMTENVSEEIYSLQHLEAVGSHKQEWNLFVDGYDAAGNRIYDKVKGQTCHQCRQKTLGKRTACAGCHSLQGVLCGDCLFMRYGENVDEVNANPDWLCPLCRDICNCSFHRSRRGWAPTGTLYRHAIAEGYLSVAHYLVLNNLSDDAKPVALERGMCPPELAAELRKELKEAAGKDGKQAGVQEAGAAAAPAPAAAPAEAAVQEQLMQLEGGAGEVREESTGAAATARATRRRGPAAAAPAAPTLVAAASNAAAPASKPTAPAGKAAASEPAKAGRRQQMRQAMLSVAPAGKVAKKQAAGKAAAAGVPLTRRGLRSAA